ncbi:hypothetical protein TIFTF001_015571 [Ficus carica]|uniref:non-specific serine/threonine protein kinase n=1 Tax=Ficus carica TaxID=3494 RepID=A0AA88A8B9_FICCA|nr:hypothetical protein TIFTF001_015571 [Ficus carica]
MNPSVSYPFSVLFLLLLILFLSSSFASHTDDQDEDRFKRCEPFDCGGIKNISYPFRGNHQPEYCGHPDFVVNCKPDRHQPENCGPPGVVVDCEQDRGILVYEEGKKFRVVGINQTARVLTIARMDFWDSYCPKKFINTTLSSTPFHYTKKDKNTTLLYDCDEIPEFSHLFGFPCDVNNVRRWAYFVANETELESPEVIWPPVCRVSVVVPVMEEALKFYTWELPFGSILEGGFEVEWNITDEDKCEKCVGTGGRCGHDSSNTKNNSFMCFCPLHHQSDGLICRHPEEPVPEKSQSKYLSC